MNRRRIEAWDVRALAWLACALALMVAACRREPGEGGHSVEQPAHAASAKPPAHAVGAVSPARSVGAASPGRSVGGVLPASPPLAAPTSVVSAGGPAPLPTLERERLAYLFEAAALVARSWPQLSVAETCVLLVDRAAQWAVNCDEAPAGFVRTAERFRGRPVFAHAAETFEVSGETRTTAQLLAQTPAAARIFGFGRRPTARGSSPPWLLIGTLEALREFHPAFGPAKTAHWLSVAVHEFVHIHQLRQPSLAPYLQPIEAGTLHPGRLTARYGHDAQFRATIAREYRGLSSAARDAKTADAAREALRRWLQSYRRRSAQLALQKDGAALLHEERLFTYLEGVARFVESDFLVNGDQHPPGGPADDPHFHHFRHFEGRGYAVSPNRQLDPQYYYAIGYHLCVLLEVVDPTWFERVDAQPGWLIGLVEELITRPGK